MESNRFSSGAASLPFAARVNRLYIILVAEACALTDKPLQL